MFGGPVPPDPWRSTWWHSRSRWCRQRRPIRPAPPRGNSPPSFRRASRTKSVFSAWFRLPSFAAGGASPARRRNWDRCSAWIWYSCRTRCIHSCRYRHRPILAADPCRISRISPASRAPCPLPRLVEQFAADQHAADLAGTGADLIQLGIAQKPAGGKIVDVTIAAQGLDCFQRHPGRLLRREKDGACRILAGCLVAIAGPGHRIDIGTRGAERRVHVRELALHQLKFTDGLAELVALVDIGHDHV